MNNPRPVYVALIGKDERVHDFPVKDADPRTWQPFAPGDLEYQPLLHKVHVRAPISEKLSPGHYRIGLWMPDHDKRLQLDPRYAVRVANRAVPWWTDGNGRYGINIIANVQVVP